MKIGVLGGTFDPVHNGHISMAEEAYKSLGLTEVMMVPAWQPMSKPNEVITPAEQRLEMLMLAIAGKPYLKISTIEIERKGPSYTVDTIDELGQMYGREYNLYFILGWDSLALLTTWHEPKRLIKKCILVTVPRPGYIKPDLKELENDIPGITEKVIFLEKPRIDISATTIRGMVGMGEKIDSLVPKAVEEYIRKNKLYISPLE
jgi:nicotinate-nucleotide adenylyltransferase